jgi:hypothetical protein
MDAVFAERQRQIIAVLDDEEQEQFRALIARMLTANGAGIEDGGCPLGPSWGQVARAMARDAVG